MLAADYEEQYVVCWLDPVELERSPTERVKRIPVTDRNR